MRRDATRKRKRVRSFPDPPGKLREYSEDEITAAKRWLRRQLFDGDLYHVDLRRMAEDSGISWSLLLIAKKRLRVRSINRNNRHPKADWKLWFWSLPLDDDEDDDEYNGIFDYDAERDRDD